MMRILALALVLLVPQAFADSEPTEWIVWSDDGREGVSVSGDDIDTVRVGTSDGLHLALDTFDGGLPVGASSYASFVLKQGTAKAIRFAWDLEPSLSIDDEAVQGWQATDTSGPLGWHVVIPWDVLGADPMQPLRLQGLDAGTARGAPMDSATGPDLQFTPRADGTLDASAMSMTAGTTIEGPDLAGGTSVTVDPQGRPLLSYYIYDDGRQTERGIYFARIDSGAQWVATKVTDTMITAAHGRDAQMRTQIAHDGKETFILFTDDPAVDNDEDGPGHPGTPDSVYVLARHGDEWIREDPTPSGTSDVGPEDVADLAARAGKVVVAIPVGEEVWIVTRTGPDAWEVTARLADAHNAKVALDGEGNIHVAYVQYPDAGMRSGTLYYATSRDGFTPLHVGDNIDAGWEEPETDGSFAIATGLEDQVAILWNDGRADRDKEQPFTILTGGATVHGHAPLVPGHGNPQYTMRLGFTQDGRLVAASGYGGTDSLAVRTLSGAWFKEELPRYDVWDMAVAPAGIVYFGYTQPHGGTTVALTAYGEPMQLVQASLSSGTDPGLDQEVPGIGTIVLLGLLVMLTRRR